MRSTFWTPERVEILKKLWAEDVSVEKIMEQLGATKGQVAGKRYLLNLPLRGSVSQRKKTAKPKPTPKRKAEPAKKVVKPTVRVKDPSYKEALRTTEGIPPDTAVSVLEVQPGQCRWPFGHPKSEDFRFCGRPVRLDQMFCCEHRAIAYRKIERRKRK